MTSGHREASRECWTGTGFGENHVKVTAAAMAIRATRSRTDIIDKKHTPQHKKVLYKFAICEHRVAPQHCFFGSTVLNPTFFVIGRKWMVVALLLQSVRHSNLLFFVYGSYQFGPHRYNSTPPTPTAHGSGSSNSLGEDFQCC